MKTKLTVIILLIAFFQVNAQNKSGEIFLKKGISLLWTTEVFNPKKHNIETCLTKSTDKFICKIDGKPWFGSDLGMENPKNQLTKLTLKIDSDLIELDVSNMFNPSSSGELSVKQFLLKKEGEFYKLYSFFSDGAGTYTVYWKIIAKSSVREIISNDERYFDWQTEKK